MFDMSVYTGRVPALSHIYREGDKRYILKIYEDLCIKGIMIVKQY